MSATTTTRLWLIGTAFVAGYVALDYVSYVKPYRDIGVTPWNPSAGLAIALVFLEGLPLAPFVLAAPFIADMIVRDTSVPVAIDLAGSLLVGGTFIAAGLGLQRTGQFDPRLRCVRDVITLAVVAALTAVVAAGAIVVMFLSSGLLMRDEVMTVFGRSAVGDIIGILTVVSVVLLWRTHRPWPAIGPTMPLQLLAILAALVMVFGYRDASAFQLFYLLFLPILWVALSYGPPGAASALAIVQIGIVIGAEIRFGPDPGFSALQVLMIALAITGLVVGAIVAEREDGAARLRDQQAALNRTLRIRSAGEIAATIAHEMNQPLTALATYGGIASKALRDGDQALAQRAVAKVEDECQRAASVMTGIRDLLRQGALNKQTVILDRAFAQISELVRGDLSKRGIFVSFQVEDRLPSIAADPIQLQQALHNMVVNSAEAIESMGREGRVTVRAARADDRTIRIDVADNGPGFPPAYDITDPPPFTSTKAEGSGIGLTVVRSIAEAHGGSFNIQSSPRGATVSLRLPIGEHA